MSDTKMSSKKKWIIGGSIVAVLALGTALGQDNDDAPEVIEVEATTAEATPEPEPTEEPEPTPEPTEEPDPEPSPEPEPVVAEEPEPVVEEEPELDFSEDDFSEMALEIVWNSSSAADQEQICWGWETAPGMMVDAFMDGAEDSFTREQVRAFFDEVC